MFRLQSMLFAAMLMTSATAFAADTPDPNSPGEAAVPSGSNAASPPADDSMNTVEGKSELAAPPTTPPGDYEGKPAVKAE